MKEVFKYFNEDDADNPLIVLETQNTGEIWERQGVNNLEQKPATLSHGGESERDTIKQYKLPKDRIAKYRVLEKMSKDTLVSTALDIHLAHAFSVDLKTGRAITLKPKPGADESYVNSLQVEVVDPINDILMNLGRVMCTFGVGYARPHCSEKVGISSWEYNYHTLPFNIREYEKAGELTGFTSENLKRKDHGGNIELAPPWALVGMKLPNWIPSMTSEPVRYSAEPFSLYDDAYHRTPIETQNYGQSLLETVYEPFMHIQDSLLSLIASRNNASHIDRFVTIPTDGLDIGKAAEYINTVTSQFKKDKEQAAKKANSTGILPTVWNHIFPSMQNAKGSVTVDTQTISPDIAHIEDVMFHLKRFAGGIGIDPSMLGFSDMLSGGLGEGGFLRTSIHSALKALLLRKAAYQFTQRSIDIHTAFKDGKVWLPVDRPYTIEFNSMSTAIAIEEAEAREAKANYASIIVTVLDTLENSPISKSETLKETIYTKLIDFDDDLVKKIIEELALSTAQDTPLMEAMKISKNNQNEQYIRDVIFDVFSEVFPGE